MELLQLEPFQETLGEAMCGPASLKIVLTFFGVEKTEAELAQLVGKSSQGSDDAGIVAAARSLGFEAVVKNDSDFKDIEGWLSKQVPVVVNWFTRGRADYSDSSIADGHYSVVAGLDDQYIYLQDPEIGGIRKIEKQDFLKVWFDFTGPYIRADELVIRQLIAIHPRK